MNFETELANEIAMQKSEKIVISEEISRHKSRMAEQLRKELTGHVMSDIGRINNNPVPLRKPFKVRLKEFVARIRIIFGLG